MEISRPAARWRHSRELRPVCRVDACRVVRERVNKKRVGSFLDGAVLFFRTRFVLSCRKESKNTILMFVLSLMLEENSILTELHLVARVWLELCTISALSYGLMQKLYLLMHSTEVRKLELLLSWSCRKWKPRTGLVRPSRPLRHPMR